MAAPQQATKKELNLANLHARIDAIFAAYVQPAIPAASYQGLAGLYIRVSTFDQGERYSLPSQLRALLAKANREGYAVRREHIFLDTHSGKVSSRPGFDQFKALSQTGAVAAAIIYDMSRFARKTMDALRLAGELKRYNVKLDFVEMPYEDTPTGVLTFTQMAAVAEFLGAKIVADSKRGREQQMDEGWLPHRAGPLGYICLSKQDVLNGKSHRRIILANGKETLAPATERHPQLILNGNKEDYRTVREAYRMADGGETCYAIAQFLNERGWRTGGWNGSAPMKPGLFGRSPVHRLLTNPTYRGLHHCDGRDFPCDQLIDGALFDRVQAKLRVIREQTVGRPTKQYLLVGFLWCGEDLESGELCGRRMVTNPKRQPYYRCGNVNTTTYERRCFASGVRCGVLEPLVWSEIWAMLTSPDRLLEMGEAHYARLAKPQNGHEAKLEKELRKLEIALANINLRLNDGNLVYSDQIAADLKAKKARIAVLSGELASVGRVVNLPPLRRAKAALAELTGIGGEPKEYPGRRAILDKLEGLHMTYRDGNLTIEGRVPLPALNEKNCLGSQPPQVNSLASIPFNLKVRVA